MKELYFTKTNITNVTNQLLDEIEQISGKNRKLYAIDNHTALLVLDMQNYFLQNESNAFIPSAPAIIDNINLLMDFAKQLNLPLIFTRHTNTQKNAQMMDKWWHYLMKPHRKITQISELINLPDNPIIFEKHQYDAFYQTGLDEYLRAKSINTLIVCGVMTNLCVETTIRSAFVHGYECILAADATASYNYEYHHASCINLNFGFAHISSTQKIIGAINE